MSGFCNLTVSVISHNAVSQLLLCLATTFTYCIAARLHPCLTDKTITMVHTLQGQKYAIICKPQVFLWETFIISLTNIISLQILRHWETIVIESLLGYAHILRQKNPNDVKGYKRWLLPVFVLKRDNLVDDWILIIELVTSYKLGLNDWRLDFQFHLWVLVCIEDAWLN